jgi:hypothetical protein
MKRMLASLSLGAMLAGCSATAQDGTLPSATASWMTSLSPKQDLLYVTDVGTNEVYVYSYPQGELVGTLTGFYSPVRACSDTVGNVYITNTNAQQILKYAHGGKAPKSTYSDPGWVPVDCAVDPITKTLAVTNYSRKGSNTGSVTIYADGKAKASYLQSPNVQAYLFCTYDDAGNLFVDGLDDSYDFVLIELPIGAKKFKPIALKQPFSSWGGIQWDGKYVALGDGISTIYDFAVSGGSAKKVRTIKLRRAVNVDQFWLSGSTLIAPDGPNGGRHDAAFWKYPQGGAPTKTLGSGVFRNPSGATISVAP